MTLYGNVRIQTSSLRGQEEERKGGEAKKGQFLNSNLISIFSNC